MAVAPLLLFLVASALLPKGLYRLLLLSRRLSAVTERAYSPPPISRRLSAVTERAVPASS